MSFAALGDPREQDLRRIGCVELGIEIDGARDREQRLAPLRRCGIEQARGPVEPPAGNARERRHLLVRKLGCARADRLAHRALGQAAERHRLAARADRLRQRPEIVRHEQHHRVRRRLLEILQQCVGGVLVHGVRAEDDVDAARRLERAHVQVAAQLADVVDADLVAERLEHVEIRVRAPRDACVVAEQLGREQECVISLADAGRPVQEIRVRRAFGERRREQTLRLELFGERGEAHASLGSTAAQISSAISSTPRRSPSSLVASTTCQPSRWASWR